MDRPSNTAYTMPKDQKEILKAHVFILTEPKLFQKYRGLLGRRLPRPTSWPLESHDSSLVLTGL